MSSNSTFLVEEYSNSGDDFDETDIKADVNKMEVNETCTGNDKVKIFCDICLSDNTESTAECFCVECVQYFCKNCQLYHKKCKVTKGHKEISENISDGVSVYKLMGKLLSCNIHPKLKITHYCNFHRINLCLSCVVENHRKCLRIHNVLEVAPEMSSKRKEILTHMDIHQQSIASHIVHCRANIKSIAVAKEEIFHSVRDRTDSLIEAVLDMKKKTEAKIQQVSEEAIKSLQDDIDLCERLGQGEFEERELVEFLERHDDSDDSKIAAQVIWSNIIKHKNILSHLDARPRHLHFTRNLELSKGSLGCVGLYFEDKEAAKQETLLPMEHYTNKVEPCTEDIQLPKGFASLTVQSTNKEDVVCDNSSHTLVKECKYEHIPTGQLKCEREDGYSVDSSKAPVALDTSNSVISEVPTLRPEYTKNLQMLQMSKQFRKMYGFENYSECINVHYIKLADDEAECSISKCVVLESGSICLIDSSNKKLKKIDPTFNKCLSTNLKGAVSDICNPKDELVAMICDEEHTISVVDLHNDLFATVRNILLPKHQSFKCITKDKQNERYLLLYEIIGNSIINYVIQFRTYSGTILCNLAVDDLIGMSIVEPSKSANIGITYTPKGLVLVGKVLGLIRITFDFSKSDNRINLIQKQCKIIYNTTNNNDLEGMISMACDSGGNIYICTTSDHGSIYEYQSFRSYQPKRIASGINEPTCVDCISKRKILICFKKGDCVHVYNMKNWD